MTAVFDHSEARGNDRLVLLVIADRSDDDGTGCWRGRESIAHMARIHPNTVTNAIRRLEELGELIVERRDGNTSAYQIVLPSVGPSQELGGLTDGTLTSSSPTTLTTGCEGVSQPVVNDTSIAVPDTSEGQEQDVEFALDLVPTTSRASVDDVFDFWRSETKHPRAKLDRKRRQRIEWAQEHYDDTEIADAIRGAASSPFHQGQNDRGTRYDDLTLILRDAEHLERFIDIYRHPVPKIPKAWGALTQMAREGAR